MKPEKNYRGAVLKLSGRFVLTGVFAVLCLLSGARIVFGQSIPLDDKARYEHSLEVKIEAVLLKLLGPNQAKVVVQADMDFTRTEKTNAITQATPAAVKEGMFKWDGASVENQMSAEYLLPGFPTMDSTKEKGGGSTSFQKQMTFPDTFIKKLVVTVVLNQNLSESETQEIRNVVSGILSMDQKRGDELAIIKTPFAPFWRTVWYTPEAMNLVFKSLILAVLGIFALIVVAIGFLKLAGAMNNMAKAQQGHQITMEMGAAAGAGGAPAAAGPAPGGTLDLLVREGTERDTNESGGGDFDKVVFNVRKDQVVFLVSMMGSEDPANVALVAAHLPPDVRGEFLRRLSPDAASEVISHMAKVRFVEPDLINTIKDELERRLSGALGGVHQVIEVLERVNLRAKKEMLERLLEKDPETARLVRSKVFLTEDLSLLSEKDMSVVISNFKVEVLASALWEFPQALKDAIKKQMADKTWQMVEQTMKYGAPSRDTSEKAAEELVELTLKLIKEGRIVNPLEEGAARLTGPEAQESADSSAAVPSPSVPEQSRPEPPGAA